MPGSLAICRLAPDAPLPSWAAAGRFFSITRTAEELSIVCAEDDAPADVKAEKEWRALKAEGPLDFSAIGIIASLAVPLAAEGISLFVVSTFDTDYILVKQERLEAATAALARAGHRIRT
jgi:hypothetical protein